MPGPSGKPVPRRLPRYYCFAESDADEALTPEGWELHLNEACAESRNYAEGTT